MSALINQGSISTLQIIDISCYSFHLFSMSGISCHLLSPVFRNLYFFLAVFVVVLGYSLAIFVLAYCGGVNQCLQ